MSTGPREFLTPSQHVAMTLRSLVRGEVDPKTPDRYCGFLNEQLAGYGEDPREPLRVQFDAPAPDAGFVVVRAIPFYSLCEHHLMPFHGLAHVGYMPAARMTGLSKIARCVDILSKRLQVQERLTAQIADTVEDVLDTPGVAVVIDAEHLCMTMRGIRAAGATTRTSALRGVFRTDPAARAEMMRLLLWESS